MNIPTETIMPKPHVNTLGGNQSLFESTGGRRKSRRQKAKKSRKSIKRSRTAKRSRRH